METNEQVRILQDLIRLHSVNGNEIAVADYLQKLFLAHGIDVAVDAFGDRRANLVAQIGEGTAPRTLGFTGHMDTVAVPNSERW